MAEVEVVAAEAVTAEEVTAEAVTTPAADAASGAKTTTAFSSARFHRVQLRHFILFDVLPLLGTVAAFALIPMLPPTSADIAVFLSLWLATGLGLTVGFHRYFSHRSFATTRTVALALLVLGSMSARGPMISWAAMHRRHHQRSDREGDLHSPNLHGPGLLGRLHGFVHAHLTWMIRHDYPNVMHYVPDIMSDKAIVRWNRRYYGWVALGLVIPATIGGIAAGSLSGVVTGFLWGGMVRIFVVEHTMSTINSLCHVFGVRQFEVRDDNSRNNAWLSLPTWGEACHNNHHAFPGSAAFGLRPYELDPGYWLIRGLEVLGLAWNVRVPSPAQISERQC
jgi:stearoyl-CoA desaturase (Delta-9 desaturase)